MRVFLRSILVASMPALAAPVAHAARPQAAKPSEAPGTQQVEVSEVEPRLRAGSAPVEFTATLRNAGRTPLFLEPEVTVRGTALAPANIMLELFDPAADAWNAVVLDPTRNNHAFLPYRGTRALSATAGRMAPGENVTYRLRYAFAAPTEPQELRIEVGGRYAVPVPGQDTHFGVVASIPLTLFGLDGARPPVETAPDFVRSPSVPNVGPAGSGGAARAVGDNVDSGGPAVGLSGLPGWIRAGAGAFEFRVTVSNSRPAPIPGVIPQIRFTGDDFPLAPDQLGAEVLSSPGGGWQRTQLKVMADPDTGRTIALVGDLWPDGPDGGALRVAEMAEITVRVWFPATSAAVGHDVAVLAGVGLTHSSSPISHSDFHVVRVTAGGAPTAAPTFVPQALTASTPPPEAAAEQGRAPVTIATIALWLALAGIGGAVVYFARKNRRAGTEPPAEPPAGPYI